MDVLLAATTMDSEQILADTVPDTVVDIATAPMEPASPAGSKRAHT
jgi:hypothetical protein